MNYQLNDSKMFMDISDGIAVIINSETGIYFGMNSFGTAVFEALTTGMSGEAVAAALKAMPGAPADMEARLSAFIEKLLGFDMLVAGPAGAELSFDAAVAAADDFVLEVESFSDAQEMLLADPIHEVSEESGWTPEKTSIGYSKEETKKREQKVD